jgi:hypothetical protein
MEPQLTQAIYQRTADDFCRRLERRDLAAAHWNLVPESIGWPLVGNLYLHRATLTEIDLAHSHSRSKIDLLRCPCTSRHKKET